MNNIDRLIRLGSILEIKLASINAEEISNVVASALEAALRNASNNSSLGIMPYEKMAKQDELNLIIDITRDDGLGHKITADVSINTPEKAYLLPKYAPLKNQVEEYLTKNWEVYPGSISGEKIKYDNFTARLNINANPMKSSQVAKT